MPPGNPQCRGIGGPSYRPAGRRRHRRIACTSGPSSRDRFLSISGTLPCVACAVPACAEHTIVPDAKWTHPIKFVDSKVVIMAEREGFEPSIEFPLYTLSKRAPSTTRPSLQFYETPLITRAQTALGVSPQNNMFFRFGLSIRKACSRDIIRTYR